MTHLACPVSTCDRPRKGSDQICGACGADLRRALEQVPELAAELDVTLSRQTGLTYGSGKSAETPLPYAPQAGIAAGKLRVTLVGWVLVMQERATIYQGPVCERCRHLSCVGMAEPKDEVGLLALWLLWRFQSLVRHAAAVEICEEIVERVQEARKAIDRRPDTVYAGRCDYCQTHMYGRVNRAMVICPNPECAIGVPLVDRRDQLMESMRDYLANSVQLSRLLSYLGRRVPDRTIRWWAGKGRIAAHGIDTDGHPMYRLGDVLDLRYPAHEKV